LSARGQGSWQIPVTDESCAVAQECRISKYMIRVTVSVYDVSDGLFRAGANGREQLPSFADTASGIDHRDRAVADDESDIGDSSFILTCHERGEAVVHEYPRCDFADWQRALLRLRECRCSQHGERDESSSAMNHNSASVAPEAKSTILRLVARSMFASQHARRTSSKDCFLLRARIEENSIWPFPASI